MENQTQNPVTPTLRISRVQIAVLTVSVIANITLGFFAISTPLTGAALKSDAAAIGKNCDPEFGCAGDLDKAVATQATSNDTSGTGIFSSIGNGMKSVGNTIGNAMGQTGISENNLVNGATRIIGDTGVGALTGTAIAAVSGGNIKEAAIGGGATMGGLSLVNQALSGGTGNSITGSALGAIGIGTGGGGLVDTLSNTFSGSKSASTAATAEPPCVLDTKGQPLTIPASSWGNPASTAATTAGDLDCTSLVATREVTVEQFIREYYSSENTMEKDEFLPKLKEKSQFLNQLADQCPSDVKNANARQKALLNQLNDAARDTRLGKK